MKYCGKAQAFHFGKYFNGWVRGLHSLTAFFRKKGEREGAVIPLNLLRGYTDPSHNNNSKTIELTKISVIMKKIW
jgi:hypothetical protein